MNLTKYEQETIINYNNEEKTASVYTHDKALIRKLDKKLGEIPDMKLISRTTHESCERKVKVAELYPIGDNDRV